MFVIESAAPLKVRMPKVFFEMMPGQRHFDSLKSLLVDAYIKSHFWE